MLRSSEFISSLFLGTDLIPIFLSNLSQAISVEKDTPLEIDPGFLLVTDSNPIQEEAYKYVKYISYIYYSDKTFFFFPVKTKRNICSP